MVDVLRGHRSRTGKLAASAKPRVGRLALESGAPVVPVAILGSSGPELEANAVPEGDDSIRSAVQIRCCCRDDTGSSVKRRPITSSIGSRSFTRASSSVHIGASVACRRRPQVSDAMPTPSSAPARMTATRVTASISPGAATQVSLVVLDQPGGMLCGGSRPAARSGADLVNEPARLSPPGDAPLKLASRAGRIRTRSLDHPRAPEQNAADDPSSQ